MQVSALGLSLPMIDYGNNNVFQPYLRTSTFPPYSDASPLDALWVVSIVTVSVMICCQSCNRHSTLAVANTWKCFLVRHIYTAFIEAS